MDDLMEEYEQLVSAKIPNVQSVVPVFREVFAKEKANG
jgi:hypothetical protein